MRKIAITTDMAADMPQGFFESNGVTVLPMPFTLGGKDFFDGDLPSPAEFYGALRAGAAVSTSQTSAYAAIHAGFQAPELFGKIVADSFDGSTLPNEFARSMTEERRRAKADPSAREFYRWCQGEDWERVVDQDTEALVHLARRPGPLFPRPIGEIQCPLLVTVSREDEMLSGHCIEESKNWTAAAPQITCRIFETGGHPLIYSQAEELAALICDFFEEAP